MLAKLIDRQTLAEGTVGFTLLPEAALLEFVPGQFFNVGLLSPPYTDQRGNSRYFGFTDPPQSDGKISGVFRLGPSAFKRYFLEMPLGTSVEVSGVSGTIKLPDNSDRPVVFIAGGIGIAPVICLLRRFKSASLPHHITLLYSNTNSARTLFLPELQELASQNDRFNLTAVMTQDPGWSGDHRRLNSETLTQFLSDFVQPVFFITGTSRFVPDMVKALKTLNVSMDRIKFEIFSGY